MLLDPLHGDNYQFWSGIGSGSPILAGVGVFWRKHNCHQHGCWRLAKRAHGDLMLCHRHHPKDPPKEAVS